MEPALSWMDGKGNIFELADEMKHLLFLAVGGTFLLPPRLPLAPNLCISVHS